MIAGILSFSVNLSTEEDIRTHLLGCDHFSPPLSERVDLAAYSRKVRDNALTVEAWHGAALVGLVAGYMNAAERTSYITNVSVLPDFTGKSIATKLLDTFVEHARTADVETIALEVAKTNPAAMHLFSKFEFQKVEDRGGFLLMRALVA